MTTNRRMHFLGAVCGLAMLASAGCTTAVSTGVKVVGKVVDDSQAKQLGEELLGKDAAAVDAKLGQPLDVWRDTAGPREWRVYPVPMNVMGNERYVAQMNNGKVAGIAKVAMDNSGIDLARKLMLDQKVDGKTPQECQTALDMGPPLVTARSEKTGMMAQLYNAKMIQGVGSPQYCRLRFDTGGHCTECALVDVGGSVGQVPQ